MLSWHLVQTQPRDKHIDNAQTTLYSKVIGHDHRFINIKKKDSLDLVALTCLYHVAECCG